MAAIKSYTDIKQSKKLAEILPIESADMWYSYYGNSTYNPTIAYKGEQWFLCQFRNSFHTDIPCWSASALLEVIRNNGRYELQMFEGGYYFEANGFMTESYFNTVDACVKMILKLHELEIL